MTTTFLRLLSENDKASALASACNNFRNSNVDNSLIELSSEVFREIPGTPFAYWAPKSVVSLFTGHEPAESEERRFTKGLCTTDDFRFIRTWWEANGAETSQNDQKWFDFVNGSKSSSFYLDINLSLNWKNDGKELKAFLDNKIGKANQWSRWINSVEHYFRAGVTWPLRSSRYSPQALPAGVIFSIRSYAGFETGDNPLAMLGVLSSRIFDYLFKVSLGRFGYPEFVVGVIQKMPFPKIMSDDRHQLESRVKRCWELRRISSTMDETSHAFVLPERLRSRIHDTDAARGEAEIARIQDEIDEIVIRMYGLSDPSGLAVLKVSDAQASTTHEGSEDLDDDVDDDEAVDNCNQEDGLLSWAVGVAFGRFDWRMATGERPALPEPGPFDRMPLKSPGMLPDLAEPFHRHAGFLVDDPGHPHDLPGLMEEVLQGVGASLAIDTRRWLQREYFSLHLKRYSKSRRKAPIYWRLSTPSGRYSVWLYSLRVNSDTFFRLKQDVIDHKITTEERALVDLRQSNRDLGSRERQDIENQETFVGELKQLADEVKRVAPLWSPNLDDGAVLTMAPLWRMSASNPGWQKELRAKWAELQSGKHDWSHQAMHLWPERVVPKCAEDRSLAIAHDLEDVFWSETESGKWAKRDVPTRSVDEIVRERTSDAVKAALKELLEAPEPAATGSRSRRRA